MTRGLLKEEVYGIIGSDNDLRYSAGDWQKANVVIDRRVNDFMSKSLCLFKTSVPLVIVAHQADYSLLGLATPVVKPVDVFMEGVALFDYWGKRDRSGWPEITEYVSDYPLLSENKPTRWVWNNKETITLIATPDQVYANCSVSGWCGHVAIGAGATIAASRTADLLDNIEVPTEWLDPLAEYVALGFLSKTKHAELYGTFETRTTEAIKAIHALNAGRNRGTVVRGKNRSGLAKRVGRY